MVEKSQDLEQIAKKNSKFSSGKIYDSVKGTLRGFIEVSTIYPTAMRKFLTRNTPEQISLKDKAYDMGVIVPNAPFGPLSVALWDTLLIYMPLMASFGKDSWKPLFAAQMTTNALSLLCEGGRGLYKLYKYYNQKSSKENCF